MLKWALTIDVSWCEVWSDLFLPFWTVNKIAIVIGWVQLKIDRKRFKVLTHYFDPQEI